MDSKNDKFNYDRMIHFGVVVFVFWIYFYSNPSPQYYYDYTFRVADNILRGAVGFQERPPSWLNEFVPYGGYWYSVFPLGCVLTMMPFVGLKSLGLGGQMPAALIASVCAAAIAWFVYAIAGRYDIARGKQVLLTLGAVFGTWMWTNLAFAGAWQLALGFAMLGELGAIYFTIFKPRPLIAGLFFALAFGNRTEVLLTAPVFFYLIARGHEKSDAGTDKLWNTASKLTMFCAVPFVLGVLTLFYNYIRFESFTDFGHSRIPGVLNEPWYRYGIFSIYYIPLNVKEMLISPWRAVNGFPYFIPNGFGSAIWWSSPFLLLLFKFGGRDKILKYAAWIAIAIMTLLLWTHGNPGGWQFGYRYAMILLPWIFIILLESSPKKIVWYEWLSFLMAFAINAFATYLFFWTELIKP